VNESRTDQITLDTRILGGVVIIVLLLAFLALYINPTHTDQNFAWTILPPTSAILMGAGYTAGAYFFGRVVTEKHWHRVQTGFWAITAFTIWMFAATLLHLDRFHHGTIQYYAWTGIYALTPLLVPFMWWRNHATASTELEKSDLRYPAPVRWLLGIGALIAILTFIVVFIQASLLISTAPWKLTPLTARVFAGWSSLTLFTVLMIAYDGRWSATRIPLQSGILGMGLTLLAVPRMWPDIDKTMPMGYGFVAAIPLGLLVFIVLHIWLDRLSRPR